ncbi:LOW QUALITY PROTEIN: hypothetical protein HID58_067517, partial [Brassica napus]
GSYQETDNGGKTCCSYCFGFIFTAGLTSLFLWLSLRPDKPKCSIKDLYIYYDDVHLSFSSNNNSSLATYRVPRFYQGHTLPLDNKAVSQAVLPNGSAMDLKTQVRFKIVFWKTKRYGIEVGADVEVNGDGVKAHKKGIKMEKSDSSARLRSYFPFEKKMSRLEAEGRAPSCWWRFGFWLIIIAGLIILIVWINLRPTGSDIPKCSIEYFYVPALNKTLNSRLNTTLNFMVRLANPNSEQGIYYDDVHLSFSSVTYVFIANYTVPRFYQGRKKKAKKWGQVVPLNNQTVLEAVLPNGLASFRINLKTQVRYKNSFWKTRRFGVVVGAEVGVNGDGVKANKKGIRLKKSDSSSSSSLRSYF